MIHCLKQVKLGKKSPVDLTTKTYMKQEVRENLNRHRTYFLRFIAS